MCADDIHVSVQNHGVAEEGVHDRPEKTGSLLPMSRRISATASWHCPAENDQHREAGVTGAKSYLIQSAVVSSTDRPPVRHTSPSECRSLVGPCPTRGCSWGSGTFRKTVHAGADSTWQRAETTTRMPPWRRTPQHLSGCPVQTLTQRERERETFLTLHSRNRPLVPCAALVTRPV